MSTFDSTDDFRPAPRRRLQCAALGATCSMALGAGMLALFAQASQVPWLPQTPQALALAQACARQPSRDGRNACMAQAVAKWQADRGLVRVAAAGR